MKRQAPTHAHSCTPNSHMRAHTHTPMLINTYTHTHTHTHTHTCSQTNTTLTSAHTHTHTHTLPHTYSHAYSPILTHEHTHTHVRKILWTSFPRISFRQKMLRHRNLKHYDHKDSSIITVIAKKLNFLNEMANLSNQVRKRNQLLF